MARTILQALADDSVRLRHDAWVEGDLRGLLGRMMEIRRRKADQDLSSDSERGDDGVEEEEEDGDATEEEEDGEDTIPLTPLPPTPPPPTPPPPPIVPPATKRRRRAAPPPPPPSITSRTEDSGEGPAPPASR